MSLFTCDCDDDYYDNGDGDDALWSKSEKNKSEWGERTSEQMSEWSSTYVWILGS